MGFKVNPGELENTATDFGTNSTDLHAEIEDFAAAYLKEAGIAYGEGTDIDEALKLRIDQAIKKAEDGVDELTNQKTLAENTNARLHESESASVGVINSNLN